MARPRQGVGARMTGRSFSAFSKSYTFRFAATTRSPPSRDANRWMVVAHALLTGARTIGRGDRDKHMCQRGGADVMQTLQSVVMASLMGALLTLTSPAGAADVKGKVKSVDATGRIVQLD